MFNLFDETFNDTGRKLPSSRPSMRKWYDELKRTYSLINKCECGGYSYTNVNSAVKKQCLLCGKDIQVNGKIRLFSGNTIVKNAINEKFMNEINNDINEDDDFYFREEMADKFVKELEYKLIMEFPIYSGLKLYDFNLDEVTIDRMPSEVVDFKIVGDSLIIDSKEQLYQKISDHELKKIAKPYKLIKGESCMIVLKRDVEKIMYVMFE